MAEKEKKPEAGKAAGPETVADTKKSADKPAPAAEKEPEPEKDEKTESASGKQQAQENGEGDASSPEAEEKSEKTDTSAEAEKASAPQDSPEQTDDAVKPEAENAAPSTQARDMELLDAKAQLAAFKCGVRADVVEDAVCLAMRDAGKTGEVTAESVADALTGVLDRHPEWKQAQQSGGDFRVGADGSKETHSSSDEISKIFGNS